LNVVVLKPVRIQKPPYWNAKIFLLLQLFNGFKRLHKLLGRYFVFDDVSRTLFHETSKPQDLKAWQIFAFNPYNENYWE